MSWPGRNRPWLDLAIAIAASVRAQTGHANASGSLGAGHRAGLSRDAAGVGGADDALPLPPAAV